MPHKVSELITFSVTQQINLVVNHSYLIILNFLVDITIFLPVRNITNDKSIPVLVVTNIDCDFTPALPTGVTSGVDVAYPSGAPELTLVFVGFVLLQL